MRFAIIGLTLYYFVSPVVITGTVGHSRKMGVRFAIIGLTLYYFVSPVVITGTVAHSRKMG